jgi:flagellar basal-body rod modification protein FlgD
MTSVSATSGLTGQQARDQFLQMLVAQVSHQDPMNPMSQENFTQQLAQFATLEGVEKLNASFGDMLQLQQLTQGANLIGRSVQYVDQGQMKTGVVASILVAEGNRLVLNIGGTGIPIDQVTGLGPTVSS